MRNDFMLSVLAGMFISLGCVVYLKVGGVIGAAMFAFGLLSIVHYSLKLFTGSAGFVPISVEGHKSLAMTWLGNLVGCIAIGLIMRNVDLSLVESSANAIMSRYGGGGLKCLATGTMCGLIMTTAVKFGREGKYLPLLFGVPLFILCGFSHSIADLFYLVCMPFPSQFTGGVVGAYSMVLFGNYIGCNIPRVMIK